MVSYLFLSSKFYIVTFIVGHDHAANSEIYQVNINLLNFFNLFYSSLRNDVEYTVKVLI